MIDFAKLNDTRALLCVYVQSIFAAFLAHIGLGADVLLPACSG